MLRRPLPRQGESMKEMLILVVLPLILMGAVACTKEPAERTTVSGSTAEPIAIVSVTYAAGQTVNPGGPTIEITLKNVSKEDVSSLDVTLDESSRGRFKFDFGVDMSKPLAPSKTIRARQILIGGGWGPGIAYSLVIGGTLRSGVTFEFTWKPLDAQAADRQPGRVFDVLVEQGTGTAWSAGVKLDGSVQVSAGRLDRALFLPGPDRSISYNAGDIAIFLEGTLTNDSDNEWQVDYWPQAFDSAENEVAWGLDQGGAPLPGHLQMNIPAHSAKAFTLHLTWAENISRITINANEYPAWPPMP